MVEPEWDDETRNIVLALDEVDICPRCGRPAEICQNPETQDDWEGDAPVRCFAATAVLDRQRGVTEETNPAVEALIWRSHLRAEASGGR